jgi:hypothetical protein
MPIKGLMQRGRIPEIGDDYLLAENAGHFGKETSNRSLM